MMFTREAFVKINFMEMEYIDITMEEYLRENGDLVKNKGGANFMELTDICKSENGNQINFKFE